MGRGENTLPSSTLLSPDDGRGINPRRSYRQLVTIGACRRLGVVHWPGEGTPLILIHGLFDSAEGYNDLCSTLERPCYCFDVPGFGRSDRPEHARVADFARDIIAAIDELEIDRFLLCGHSLGGAIASEIAAAVPNRVIGLTLLAPAGYGRIRLAELGDLPVIGDTAAEISGRAMKSSFLLGLTYKALVANGHSASKELLERSAAEGPAMIPGARMAIRALARIGRDRDSAIRRPGFYNGPVQALWGRHDHLVPTSHIETLRERLPQAEVTIWEQMGHHPQAEEPDALAKLIDGFCVEADVTGEVVASADMPVTVVPPKTSPQPAISGEPGLAFA